MKKLRIFGPGGVVNALLHKGFSNLYQSRYNSISLYYQCQTEHNLELWMSNMDDIKLIITAKHRARSWAVKHRHKLVNCSINAKHRAQSWAVKHRHKLLNCSINAKPLGTILSCQTPTQACKLFYQCHCQTIGHNHELSNTNTSL